jgi:predicted MPP superfamily phosphohydrolase
MSNVAEQLPDPAATSSREAPAPSEITHYRTIWLSDIHLGTSGCRAEYLLDFLKMTESDTLYLVGDILDGWQLRKGWYWPQTHNDVVQKILRKVRKGTQVIYVPGNHDELARQFVGLDFGGISVREEDIHQLAKALLVASVLQVLLVELLNSAVEAAVDRISLEDHRLAKRAKDVGSAAVFVSLSITLVVWLLVLWP